MSQDSLLQIDVHDAAAEAEAAAELTAVVVVTAAEPPVAVVPAAPLALALPRQVPRLLHVSEPALQGRAAACGIVAGLAVSLGLGLLTPPGSAVRQMFNPRSPQAAVPVAILCLFFWGALHALYRWRRLRAIVRVSRADLVPGLLEGLASHGVSGLLQALDAPVVAHSPLLRRVRAALEQWLLRPSLQNVSLTLEQQVLFDREAAQRGLSLVRLFVWATPVLGLIGTVVGISLAVGGFARFLSTDVDDVARIKAGLVGVTGGLSFSFLITLEGLLASLVLMLAVSGLQNREERFYALIEQSVGDRFLPALQRLAPEPQAAVLAVEPAGWAAAMTAAAREVAAVFDAAATRQREATVRALDEAAARQREGASLALDAAVARHRAVNEAALNSSREILAALGAQVAQSTAAVGDLGSVTRQALAAQTTLHAAMAQLGDSGLAGVLAGLDASIRDLKPALAQLSQPFVLQAVPAAAAVRASAQ